MNGRAILVAALVTLIQMEPGAASAGPPHAPNCRMLFHILETGDFSMSLYILPDGSGPPLHSATIRDGQLTPVDATILVALKDSDDEWVLDYPAADVWLEASQGGLAFCVGNGAIADEASAYYRLPPLDPGNPQPPHREWSTSFSGPFFGGGHTNPASGDQVVVMTASTGSTPLPGHLSDLQMNSADINGDLVVDLNDVPFFSEDYYSGYHYRCDFHSDNHLNLTDIARFIQTYALSCP